MYDLVESTAKVSNTQKPIKENRVREIVNDIITASGLQMSDEHINEFINLVRDLNINFLGKSKRIVLSTALYFYLEAKGIPFVITIFSARKFNHYNISNLSRKNPIYSDYNIQIRDLIRKKMGLNNDNLFSVSEKQIKTIDDMLDRFCLESLGKYNSESETIEQNNLRRQLKNKVNEIYNKYYFLFSSRRVGSVVSAIVYFLLRNNEFQNFKFDNSNFIIINNYGRLSQEQIAEFFGTNTASLKQCLKLLTSAIKKANQ